LPRDYSFGDHSANRSNSAKERLARSGARQPPFFYEALDEPSKSASAQFMGK
jgi:hypothetical protein